MSNELIELLDVTIDKLRQQLRADEKRWGDEWRYRPRHAGKGWRSQEERIMARVMSYFSAWLTDREPIPWLKIMGLCHIALVREKRPDLLNVKTPWELDDDEAAD